MYMSCSCYLFQCHCRMLLDPVRCKSGLHSHQIRTEVEVSLVETHSHSPRCHGCIFLFPLEILFHDSTRRLVFCCVLFRVSCKWYWVEVCCSSGSCGRKRRMAHMYSYILLVPAILIWRMRKKCMNMYFLLLDNPRYSMYMSVDRMLHGAVAGRYVHTSSSCMSCSAESMRCVWTRFL